jgi:hypothetical protein
MITVALGLLTNLLMAQKSYVYKRNVATGNLEVFESYNGLPTGSALYQIKKNLYGYLEIENIDASTNPFTKRPDYTAYSNFKSYQLPAKEIFETLETINKRNEIDYVAKQPQNNNSAFQNEMKRIAETLQNESAIANSFLKFYNSNVSFPKTLKDGWYEVVNVYDSKGLGNQLKASIDYSYNLAICKVKNNRIAEYYSNCNIFNLKEGYVFQKVKLDVTSAITNCKATYRQANSNEYNTIYFLDNILDSTKRIQNPEFSFYAIYTDPTFKFNVNSIINIQIARNKTLTNDEVRNMGGAQYGTLLLERNPDTNNCNNSNLTLGFRKTKDTNDKYSIGILRFDDKAVWLVNGITVTPANCSGTTLNN